MVYGFWANMDQVCFLLCMFHCLYVSCFKAFLFTIYTKTSVRQFHIMYIFFGMTLIVFAAIYQPFILHGAKMLLVELWGKCFWGSFMLTCASWWRTYICNDVQVLKLDFTFKLFFFCWLLGISKRNNVDVPGALDFHTALFI